MQRIICRLFLAISLLLLVPASLLADDNKGVRKPAIDKDERGPMFRGLFVSADVFGFIYPVFIKDGFYNNEASLSVNLLDRFFPIVEAGWGHCNTVGNLYGIKYNTAAPYARVGMDYNLQYKKGKQNYIYGGLRFGATSFSYDVSAPPLIDPVTQVSYPVEITGNSVPAYWLEAVIGLRARVWSNLHMGWNLRYKRMLSDPTGINGNPWFVPGYGVYGTSTLGVTYNISWYFGKLRNEK